VLLWCVVFALVASVQAQRYNALVSVTVTDLRAQPVAMNPISYQYDPLQLSQLVFAEYVHVLNQSNGWSWVEAVQQPNIVNGRWGPYKGYIQTSHLAPIANFPPYSVVVTATVAELYWRDCHFNGCISSDIRLRLSIGTWLAPMVSPNHGWIKVRVQTDKGWEFGWILASQVKQLEPHPEDQLRKALVETSRQMLGWYYFWGGRSSYISQLWDSKSVLTGVDCSGLVGTVYRTQGVLLPRDAQPMFVYSQNVTGGPSALKPGDLFFYASQQRPDHMFHVMMYIGNDQLVESSTNSTRIMEVSANFGVSVANLRWGMVVPNAAILYWGRVIKDSQQQLKDKQQSLYYWL